MTLYFLALTFLSGCINPDHRQQDRENISHLFASATLKVGELTHLQVLNGEADHLLSRPPERRIFGADGYQH
jgi:hypothetical protein